MENEKSKYIKRLKYFRDVVVDKLNYDKLNFSTWRVDDEAGNFCFGCVIGQWLSSPSFKHFGLRWRKGDGYEQSYCPITKDGKLSGDMAVNHTFIGDKRRSLMLPVTSRSFYPEGKVTPEMIKKNIDAVIAEMATL